MGQVKYLISFIWLYLEKYILP